MASKKKQSIDPDEEWEILTSVIKYQLEQIHWIIAHAEVEAEKERQTIAPRTDIIIDYQMENKIYEKKTKRVKDAEEA